MGKGKWIIVPLTVLLTVMLLTVVGFSPESEPARKHAEFMLLSQGKTERLTAWEKAPGEFYVFLPSYGQLSQLQLWEADGGALRLGDTLVQNGMTCQNFRLNQPYILRSRDGKELGSLTFVQSANLPALFIDTVSHSMEHIHKKKGNEESGSLRLYTSEGVFACSGILDSIKMRGNNTTVQEKEPYSLKLSAPADLLGMGAARKWILLSNSFDSTHMRNKLIYDFSSRLGLAYSPECQWVDLYLNGEYAGLYLLAERNEVHPQRVALSSQTGFLVSQEPEIRLEEQGLPYILTSLGGTLRVHFTSMGHENVKAVWDTVERAIQASSGIDPQTGKHWSALIDLDSWVKKYLIEEVFGNSDGGSISQFFYVDGEDPERILYAGPVWDYDMALKSNGIYVDRPPAYGGSLWYYPLCADPLFYEERNRVYSQVFLPLLDSWADDQIAAWQEQLQRSAELNQLRWEVEPLSSSVEDMKDCLAHRIDLMNSLWLSGNPYVTLSIRDINGYYYTEPIPAGEPLPAGWQNSEKTWYAAEDDRPFDFSQPITTDIAIYQEEDATVQGEAAAPAEEAPDTLRDWIPFSPFFTLGALVMLLGLADFLRRGRHLEGEQHVRRNKISS